jgi:hypothetical protein
MIDVLRMWVQSVLVLIDDLTERVASHSLVADLKILDRPHRRQHRGKGRGEAMDLGRRGGILWIDAGLHALLLIVVLIALLRP